MKVVHTAQDLAAWPRKGRRVVVMTMGALHDGHLALVRQARELGDQVVVTVFVNPLQFNESTDYERYPRDLEADVARLKGSGVDVVFAPADDTMYPDGVPAASVSAGEMGRVLEGAARPGHFDGVLTVVAKLLHLTQPDIAVFGAKDAQQVIAVRALVRDLNFPVEIATAPTVRDADGLAQSSRNVFLSASEREQALVLSRALNVADEQARNGVQVQNVLTQGRAMLESAPEVRVDYFTVMNPANAQPIDSDYRGEAVIAVAAHVGDTRLIDNVTTRIGPRDADPQGDAAWPAK
ncbi:pantoate--beta-alanine ligase [Demequina sediminicola]|uniref:pantoate--beta-alanine ligase n=1 Tax=Demequina sediminicola TaxID=1095026 RepID=UPI000A74F80E|nr:pantoate--beta-alanine ligase [Demequina sediminicola]